MYDDVLETEVREQLRDMGVDDMSADEQIAAMKDGGVFGSDDNQRDGNMLALDLPRNIGDLYDRYESDRACGVIRDELHELLHRGDGIGESCMDCYNVALVLTSALDACELVDRSE